MTTAAATRRDNPATLFAVPELVADDVDERVAVATGRDGRVRRDVDRAVAEPHKA